MPNVNWKEILATVLRAVANGLDKETAVSNITSKFAISKNNILKKL